MGLASATDPVEAYNQRVVREGWQSSFDRTLAFEHPSLRAVHAAWREKAGARAMPSRPDMDMRSLRAALPNIVLLECVYGDGIRYRVRLLGTSLASLFGGESNGRFIDEIVHPSRVSRWTAGYDTVIAARAPLRSIAWYEMPQVSYMTSESFLGPLSEDGQAIDHILIATYFSPR